jgi:HEAT repeat protein
MGSLSVREVLCAALEDPDVVVREAAAAALDRLEEVPDTERLRKWFESENLRTRVQAVYGLGRLRDRRAVEALRSALEDPIVDVRAAATRALAEFPQASLLEPLMRLLEDPERVVRRSAIQALGASGDSRVATFIEIMRDALDALAQLGGGHVERILPFTEHNEPSVRTAALKALPELVSSEGNEG